jgi:hypothetical protein
MSELENENGKTKKTAGGEPGGLEIWCALFLTYALASVATGAV